MSIYYSYTHVLMYPLISYICIYIYIGLLSRVFANGLGDRSSILGRIIPKT